MFNNRQEAGHRLAQALERFRADRPLVLGLPRGGVVVGAEVARDLGGELDVMLVKKLRAPDNPELALGAVSEDGAVYVNPAVAHSVGEYLPQEIAERREEIRQQQQNYRATKIRVSPAQRTVIIVDDGLATGATMIAALQATRLAKPQRLVAAVPVAPPETKLPEADEFVCLETPWNFQGVGQFYRDFAQVNDETVIAILKEFT